MNPIELGLLINALKNKDQGFFLVEVDSIDTLNDLMLKIKIAMGRARKKTAIISFSEKDRQDTIITFIQNKIDSAQELKLFDKEGYTYDPNISSESEWVFTR